jgi:hypothetical protein
VGGFIRPAPLGAELFNGFGSAVEAEELDGSAAQERLALGD